MRVFSETYKGEGAFREIAEFMNTVGRLLNNLTVYGYGRAVVTDRKIDLYMDGSGTTILGRAANGAETDCNTDTAKPWVRYRKSTMTFSEETSGPAVPCDPDYIYFKKSNWGGREIVIQS